VCAFHDFVAAVAVLLCHVWVEQAQSRDSWAFVAAVADFVLPCLGRAYSMIWLVLHCRCRICAGLSERVGIPRFCCRFFCGVRFGPSTAEHDSDKDWFKNPLHPSTCPPIRRVGLYAEPLLRDHWEYCIRRGNRCVAIVCPTAFLLTSFSISLHLYCAHAFPSSSPVVPSFQFLPSPRSGHARRIWPCRSAQEPGSLLLALLSFGFA